MALDVSFLDITGDQVPINKSYSFGTGTTFFLRFKLNDYDPDNIFYTVEVYDSTNNTFLFSNKVVYGQEIIDSTLAPFSDEIIPLNIDVLQGLSTETEITQENFGELIKLYTSIVEV